jgi:seryl-tRNA synthetase
MLDTQYIREFPEQIAKNLATRGFIWDVETWRAKEQTRKMVQMETQRLQQERNTRSKAIGQAKQQGQATADLMAEVAHFGEQLHQNEQHLAKIQAELQEIYDALPNIPHSSVPLGRDEAENQVLRTVGIPTTFPFEPKDHVSLAANLLDFEQASLIAGARFGVLYGDLAKLHRALAQFMLDVHTQEHGYQEVYVPYLVKSQCLYGTGQLPKMREDLFEIADQDAWLIPTSEVAVTNLVREKLLEKSILPLKYVCHSPCFRKEAGTYGKDMRGMLRQHQFDKVEIIQIVLPEHSYSVLEEMTHHAEVILQKLGLPYRVMALCTGDLGFSAARTHDLEVWLPGQNRYREISSCSNTEAFQARRMQTRYKEETSKNEYVHTLNGSGLAVGRTLIAVLENYQQASGNIRIPEILRSYMGGKTELVVK